MLTRTLTHESQVIPSLQVPCTGYWFRPAAGFTHGYSTTSMITQYDIATGDNTRAKLNWHTLAALDNTSILVVLSFYTVPTLWHMLRLIILLNLVHI